MAKNPSRRATPTAANRTTHARPGDATGMENERLRKENEAALREAATRTTLINPPPVVESNDVVVDYTDGGDSHTGADPSVRLISMDDAVADGDTKISAYDIPESEVDLDSLPDGKTDVLPEIVEGRTEEPQPAHGERRDSQQQVRHQGEEVPQARVEQREAPKVEQAHRLMRVNTDLEDITIGKDNHYTFRVGVPYKVPAYVYEHLTEKGYVLA